MENFTATRLRFSCSDFEFLSKEERTLILVFGHILNKIKLLESQIFANLASTRRPQSHEAMIAHTFGFVEFMIMMAGELREAWEAITACYFSTKLSSIYKDQIHPDTVAALKRAGKSITDREGVIHRLRNDFSFHHSPKKMAEVIDLYQPDQELSVLLCEGDNNFFEISALVRLEAISRTIHAATDKDLIKILSNVIIKEAATDITNIMNNVASIILEKVAAKGEYVEIQIPSADEMTGTYFFHSSRKAPPTP